MASRRRIAAIVASVLLGLVALAAVVVLTLTNTDWGREQLRRRVVTILNNTVHGHVSIGRVSGNLLKGLTVHDVTITDSLNAPFLKLDSATTRYGLRSFFSKKIELSDMTLWRPIVVLDRQPPHGRWNFLRIFKPDTTPSAGDTSKVGWGDYLVFHDVKVRDGGVTVRLPWEPDSGLKATARDSAIRVSLDTTTVEPRQRVLRVPNGFQQVQFFHHLTGVFPLLQIAKPGDKRWHIQTDSLQVAAYPFRLPGADVRQVRGLFLMTPDSLTFDNIALALPNSRATVSGRYGIADGGLTVNGTGSPADLHDVRFLYPALPDTGTATLGFRVALGADGNMAFRFMNMDLRSHETTMQGDLGLSFNPALRIDTTNVRFAGLTTALFEQLVPVAKSPRPGVLSGRFAGDGALDALTLDADVAFDERRTGRSRVAAVGVVGYDSGVVNARDLRVRLMPVQVALARIYSPTLPILGTIRGVATVNGSTDGRLDVTRMDLTHVDRGATSRLVGRASVAMGGPVPSTPSPDNLRRDANTPAPLRERDRARIARSSSSNPWFDVDISARPLSLVTVGRFAPAVGLRGSATGPIRMRGRLRDFSVNSALALADGGRLSVVGRLGLGDVPTYDMRARLALFDASAVVAKAPSTSITATASVRGRGSDPKTMVAALDADVSTSRIDTVAIDSSRVRVRIADALLAVDTLAVRMPQTRIDLLGTFGMAAGKSGKLSYFAQTDSLAGLARYIPHLTGKVPPRPAILAERIARARADSAQAAQKNAARIAVGERPAVRAVPVDTPITIAKDSLAGMVVAGGVLTGNLENFDVTGRAGAEGLIALGNSVKRARVAYRGTAVRTKAQSFAVAALADSLMVSGFALDSIDARATYREPGGNVQLAVFQTKASDLAVRADYGIFPNRKELLLGRLTMRFDSTLWDATHASAVRWGQPGVEVENLELVNGVGGRVYVDGTLPTEGAANLRVQVDNFQVADVMGLLQSDVPVRGLADLDATVAGPLAAPIIHATASLDSASYAGTAIPTLRLVADYADRRLMGRGEARARALAETATARGNRVAQTVPDTGRVIAIVSGNVPINLALQGVEGPRIADDAPLVADLRADSLPLDVAGRFTDAVSDVRGTARGSGSVRGTLKHPQYDGEISLVDAGFRVNAAGIHMQDVFGSLKLRGDSVVIDSIAGRTDGRIALAGGIGIKDLAKPSFDLRVTASRATVLDNEMGRVKADAQISAYGPYDGVYVSGGARVLGGVVYVPESDKKQMIGQGDPSVFAVIDTTRLVGDEELIPAQSPLLANLRTDVFVGIDRDTWVRSREANVEVYSDGDLRVRVDRAKQALVLDGIVNTDRGQYTFLSKRFQVKSGSATFVGTQELDPNLQVVAEYEVPNGRPPLTIRILIGGTLLAPRISLESDAQPPIAQSDLLSYLAFGASTGQLLTLGNGSSVSSQSAGGGLVGTAAAVARRQLASVVLGVMVDQFENRTARSLGADVFNITPVSGLPEEFAGGNFGGGLEQFVRGTQIEFGKYFSRQLYVAFTATPTFFEGSPPIPGFAVQYRFGRLRGFTLESNWQPRYFLPPPSLTPPGTIDPTNAFGLFLVRTWRF